MGNKKTKMNNGKKDKKIFGVPLYDAAEKSDTLKLVPSVLRHSFAYLNLKGIYKNLTIGIHEEGIYRIPGSKKSIREWREKFDEGLLFFIIQVKKLIF